MTQMKGQSTDKSKKIELELVEEYFYAGQHRFKLRVRGTSLVINVSANDIDEASRKAYEILRDSSALEQLAED